jgi:hypothetical protein
MSGQLGNVLYYLLLAAMFFLMMGFGRGAHMWATVIATGQRTQTIRPAIAMCAGLRRSARSIRFAG